MWFRDEVLLILSGIPTIRDILMKIFPIAVYLPLTVLNSKQEIVAFVFYKIRKKLPHTEFEAEDGMVIRDDYQGKGLGYQLLLYGNEYAWVNQIRKLYSLVNAQNLKIIRICQKLGKKKVRLVRKKNMRSGKYYSAYEMAHQLNAPKYIAKDEEGLNR
jgi:L-amino acid N-acyltransferase YncA